VGRLFALVKEKTDQRQDYAETLSGKDRTAVRESEPDVGDGSWHSDGGSPSRDAGSVHAGFLPGENPAVLWQHYIQLTEIESVFRDLKNDLAIRPVYHQKDRRIEAHIFVSFLAYCLYTTLRQRLRSLAPGLTSRAVIGKISAIQMVDVLLPTTDARLLILPRYTQPEKDHLMLLHRLHLRLPAQPPPRISPETAAEATGSVVKTF
jgi:hypothetical protein